MNSCKWNLICAISDIIKESYCFPVKLFGELCANPVAVLNQSEFIGDKTCKFFNNGVVLFVALCVARVVRTSNSFFSKIDVNCSKSHAFKLIEVESSRPFCIVLLDKLNCILKINFNIKELHESDNI